MLAEPYAPINARIAKYYLIKERSPTFHGMYLPPPNSI
jgi:hypothetical protein